MKVLLVSKLKNKLLLSSFSINFKHVAIPAAASKLFELILQNLKSSLRTHLVFSLVSNPPFGLI